MKVYHAFNGACYVGHSVETYTCSTHHSMAKKDVCKGKKDPTHAWDTLQTPQVFHNNFCLCKKENVMGMAYYEKETHNWT